MLSQPNLAEVGVGAELGNNELFMGTSRSKNVSIDIAIDKVQNKLKLGLSLAITYKQKCLDRFGPISTTTPMGNRVKCTTPPWG